MKLSSVVYALPVPCMVQILRVIRSTTPVKQAPPATDPFWFMNFKYLFCSLLISHAGLCPGLDFVTFRVNRESLGLRGRLLGEWLEECGYDVVKEIYTL